MAARYRKIDPRMWYDEKFRTLDPTGKLVATYIITAQSNRIGLFTFSEAKAAEDLGMKRDSYVIAMAKVCNTMNWCWDKASRVVFIPTWFKYNPPENPKHLKGCLADLKDLPHTPLLYKFASNTAYIPKSCLNSYLIAIEIAIPKAMAYQEQEQEQEQNQNPPPPPQGGEDEAPEKFNPLAADLPFSTPGFRLAWGEWVEYRRVRKPALTDQATKKQLLALAELTEPNAVAAINNSITQQYQGLITDPFKRGGKMFRSKAEIITDEVAEQMASIAEDRS